MSKKSKSTSKPWSKAEPFVLGAGNNLQGSYDRNAGTIQSLTDQITGLMPSAVDNFTNGNPSLNAASAYGNDVLSGHYLDRQNPYLQQQIDQTNNDVMNQVQGALGTRGLTGGSDYAKILTRELAKNETGLRYSNYANERGAMDSAAGRAPGIAAAEADQLSPVLSILGASSAPLSAASQYASGVGGLFSPYQTTTQKQGLGNTLAALGGSALSAWAGGGFR